ncbi:MAG: TetR/AcrR family transcriptional regulator [Acidimicrobiales bacterium]
MSSGSASTPDARKGTGQGAPLCLGPDATSTTERIIAAAAELFHEQGYRATTMRQIAARVGIKAASLYNHFSGKQELVFRISFDTMVEMLAEARNAVAGCRSPNEKLRAFVRAHTLYCILRRYPARVADELRDLDPGNYGLVIAVRDEYEMVLRDILSELVTAPATEVTILANAIATMASQVSVWYREQGRLSPVEIAERYADFALDAALGASRRSGAPSVATEEVVT